MARVRFSNNKQAKESRKFKPKSNFKSRVVLGSKPGLLTELFCMRKQKQEKYEISRKSGTLKLSKIINWPFIWTKNMCANTDESFLR
jgi:hypothetical protein